MTYAQDYRSLLIEQRSDGVLWISINRPEKLNATDEQLHGELARIWVDVAADKRTRVVVITGSGRAFCAGGDLDMVDRQVGDFQRVSHMLKEAGDIVYNMITCETPVISAINGIAVGAGLAVALAADISIASDRARLTDGHLRLGVAAGDHAVLLWPLLCGMAKAKYYLLTSDFISGEEAERIGLVSKCVPHDRLYDEATAVAEVVARGPQHALRWTKRSLNNWFRQATPLFEASLAMEMLGFFDADVVEGVRAVREKRTPEFPSTGLSV